MAPRFRAIIPLPKARQHQKTPFRLTLVGDFLGSRAGPRDTGVADEDVDSIVPALDLARRPLDLVRLGDVHHDDVGVEPGSFQLGAAAFGDVAIEIGDDHLGARLGQRLAAGETYSAAAAGDDRDAAIESELLEVHVRFSLGGRLRRRTGLATLRPPIRSTKQMRR